MMTKKVPKKILRIERNFFVNLRKKCFWPPTPRRAAPRRRRRFFCTGGAPPPTEIDRRAAADTMTSAHSSIPDRERPRHKPSLTTDNNYYNRPVYYGSIYEVSSRPTCRLRLHVFELDLLNSIGSGFLRVLDLTALL